MNIKDSIPDLTPENEAEIDELLADERLMEILTGICEKSGANLPIYISFLGHKLDEGFSDPGDAEMKEMFNGKRPRLKDFVAAVCLYAEMKR